MMSRRSPANVEEIVKKVLITGASGLIGSALVPLLTASGYTVGRLVRNKSKINVGDVYWSPVNGELDPVRLEGIDAVIHLAGETISERWTAAKKVRIRESRVIGTRLLAERLSATKYPPQVFISSSAIGYYGNRGSETLTEASAPGTDFLGKICQEWEDATAPAERSGIQVVHIRTGIVLSKKGGALAKMLPAFKLGVAGKLGTGDQFMSWVDIDDLLAIFLYALNNTQARGPINAVAPNPVTNAEFTKTLGHVLHRPTIFPVPAFAIRLLFGEMGQELLLGSTRVLPGKLTAAGFIFKHPNLEESLRHVLGITSK